MYQLELPAFSLNQIESKETYYERLERLLLQDLNFQGCNSNYASHNVHSFPAKFPPQLPNAFITSLTNSGDVVLDPMSGSGTTVLEAFLTGRAGVAFDIDPLALKIAQVKTVPLNERTAAREGKAVVERAKSTVVNNNSFLKKQLIKEWDDKTAEFVNYWFAPETQIELLALKNEISVVPDEDLRAFLELTFSALIITKSGGVSLALDLAHTRPHKAKVVIAKTGEVIEGQRFINEPATRTKILTKKLRSPLDEFEKRLQQNSKRISFAETNKIAPSITFGNAQKLPLKDSSVDLIVTSPPYAANAIDYMRAHKFALVWFGYPVDDLSRRRKQYIGGETTANKVFEPLPCKTAAIVNEVSQVDAKKGLVLHSYYSEMSQVLREMQRVSTLR